MKKMLLICIIFSLGGDSFAQQCPIKNLTFEGAGIRGIAYSGVIKELEEEGIISGVEKVGGTSAGAVTALMLSLGYSSCEICDVVSETEFQKFNDGAYIFLGGIARMTKKFGWYRGDEFNRWLDTIICAKTGNGDITFSQLKSEGFRELYVTGTCLNRQKLLVFSAETYPDMKVKDAVRISMSIPLYFEAVFIDSTGKVYHNPENKKGLDIVVDGGILGNFPVFLFDSTSVSATGQSIRIPNPYTLAVRIETDEQMKNDESNNGLVNVEIEGIDDYMVAFYTIVMENLNRSQLTPDDWKRTISVSCVGIGPKIRKLSDEQKSLLINSGEEHTRKYLAGMKNS